MTVAPRPFPWPYRAAVALSSDCEFTSFGAFLALQRLLNDPAGLALETAGSLFFFATHAVCHSSFAHFASLDGPPSAEAETIRAMVRAGFIDTIHAWGDFDAGGFGRGLAERAAEECRGHGLRFPVWTNHGTDRNRQNLGHRALEGYRRGDVPGDPAYHLDLLPGAGVRFHWVDDGLQERPDDGTPLLYRATARDGRTIECFRRHRGLPGRPAPNASSLPDQMLPADLDALVARRGACVYYQHLGCLRRAGPSTFEANRPPWFCDRGFAALRHLSRLARDGKCLVAATGRLLRYLAMVRDVRLRPEPGRIVVASAAPAPSPDDLEGLSVPAPGPDCALEWEGPGGERRPLPAVPRRDPDTGAWLATLPWRPLGAFPW